MKSSLCLTFLALSSLPLFGAACPSPQAKDAHALIQLEQAWAQALEAHDANAVGCIYVYRDQRWLAVAGQESLLSEPAK
jgi:hypothetical protein